MIIRFKVVLVVVVAAAAAAVVLVGLYLLRQEQTIRYTHNKHNYN